MNIKNLILISLFVFVLIETPAAYALTCREPEAKRDYSDAEYVFTGKVQKIQKGSFSRTYNTRAVVEIGITYKGELDLTETVYFSDHWGKVFEEGKEYLFYANDHYLGLVVKPCSGTREAVNASGDEFKILKELSNFGADPFLKDDF